MLPPRWITQTLLRLLRVRACGKTPAPPETLADASTRPRAIPNPSREGAFASSFSPTGTSISASLRDEQSPAGRIAQSEQPGLEIPPLPTRFDLDDEMREAFLADAIDLFERIERIVVGLGSQDDTSARRSMSWVGAFTPSKEPRAAWA